MIKSVIFDIDGVLLNSFESNVDYYQRLLVAAGYKKPHKKDFQGGIWRTLWDEIKHLTKTENETELRRIWLLAQTITPKKSLLKKPVGVEKIIKFLSKKYKLGIATSRTKFSADLALNYLGLKKYFRTIITFENFKHPKPDPESLLLAMDKLKVKPDQTVFVGDWVTDLMAAREAGVKFIGFGKCPPKDAEFKAKTFAQLMQIINKL